MVRLRVTFDWKQRWNGRLVTWGGVQQYRWLWIGPFYIAWESS